MELLLNLLWLTLALPAIWMWRHSPARGGRFRPTDCVRPLALLACVLLLLFPVVSATDDLHAMRPEMEESNPSRRLVKQAANDRISAFSAGALATQSISQSGFYPSFEACGLACLTPVLLPESAQLMLRVSRGPPSSRLS